MRHHRLPTAARRVAAAGLLLAASLAVLLSDSLSYADASGIEIIAAEAVSNFPDGIRFRLEARSDSPIEEVVVRFKVDGRDVVQYNYLDLGGGADTAGAAGVTTAEYFHRTNTLSRYTPPGTQLTYWFEITDEAGATLKTDPATFLYTDARFEWEKATAGPVTVFYHGPVGVRAQTMADTAFQTVQFMGRLLGVESGPPLRIVMYNNNAEMIGALAPRSKTISRELITEGQAFAGQNVVLLMGNGRRAKGTVSHELTHILVGRATRDAIRPVPLWFNEGLAEFGNVDPSVSYDRFLEWAVDTDRLLPIESLDQFPGDPNLVLVSYGEARSFIQYLVDRFGPSKMTELVSTYNAGGTFADAVVSTYGMTVRELDAAWREKLGAKPIEERKATAVPPTPEPTRGPLLPYTLESVAEAGVAKSPTPAAISGALEAAPTATAAPEEAATPAPSPVGAAAHTSGGACSAPTHPGGPIESSSVALMLLPLVGAAWALVRRRRRRAGRRPRSEHGPLRQAAR